MDQFISDRLNKLGGISSGDVVNIETKYGPCKITVKTQLQLYIFELKFQDPEKVEHITNNNIVGKKFVPVSTKLNPDQVWDILESEIKNIL